MDQGFFGELFDLNGDGEMNAAELGLDFMLFKDLMDETTKDKNKKDDEKK